MNDRKYWVAFSRIENIGPQKLKRIYSYFPDMQTAWQSSWGELKKTGLFSKEIEQITEQRGRIDPDNEWEALEKQMIRVITIKDSAYPKLLKEIYSPPALIYIKGNLPENLNFSLAVVGTRKTTTYGRLITPEIVKELAKAGLTIISGLAFGIDALAHQSCLEVNGRTIAVLGCGLDKIYPLANYRLGQEIVEKNSAIISEYPIGTLPLKQHFPVRNRIIAGLARGVLVIEGSQDSGSLITAKCALEQNREVLAVPGNIYNKTSAGPNNLIKMGAKAVTNATDVLEALDLEFAQQYIKNKEIIAETKEEEILLKFLSSEPIHIDELIQKSKLNTSVISSTLTMMEMTGKVKNIGGMHYITQN